MSFLPQSPWTPSSPLRPSPGKPSPQRDSVAWPASPTPPPRRALARDPAALLRPSGLLLSTWPCPPPASPHSSQHQPSHSNRAVVGASAPALQTLQVLSNSQLYNHPTSQIVRLWLNRKQPTVASGSAPPPGFGRGQDRSTGEPSRGSCCRGLGCSPRGHRPLAKLMKGPLPPPRVHSGSRQI